MQSEWQNVGGRVAEEEDENNRGGRAKRVAERWGSLCRPSELINRVEDGNGHLVSPERGCRCAGTGVPLRRNGGAVAPEPPRVQKPRETDPNRTNCAGALRGHEGVVSFGFPWGRRQISAFFPFVSSTDPSPYSRFRSPSIGMTCPGCRATGYTFPRRFLSVWRCQTAADLVYYKQI